MPLPLIVTRHYNNNLFTPSTRTTFSRTVDPSPPSAPLSNPSPFSGRTYPVLYLTILYTAAVHLSKMDGSCKMILRLFNPPFSVKVATSHRGLFQPLTTANDRRRARRQKSTRKAIYDSVHKTRGKIVSRKHSPNDLQSSTTTLHARMFQSLQLCSPWLQEPTPARLPETLLVKTFTFLGYSSFIFGKPTHHFKLGV